MKKWIYLQSLMDRNETLYYKLVIDNIKEMGEDASHDVVHHAELLTHGSSDHLHAYRRRSGDLLEQCVPSLARHVLHCSRRVSRVRMWLCQTVC
jgi:hypothetical protein